MRQLLAIFFVVGLIFVLPTQLQAANEEVAPGMLDKAVSGAIDLVTGIVEFPMQIYKGYKNGVSFIDNEAGSKTVGTVLGFFRGIGHAVGRTAWGGLELVGFWTANREDNKGVGVPLDAQYSWEMGQQYSIFKPTLKEGVTPMGRKLVHGVSDGFLGILELPGQIMKGHNEGQLGTGIVKGVWYWWSRTVYGFGSVLTCIVPNPEENPGYAYQGKWPWSDLMSETDK